MNKKQLEVAYERAEETIRRIEYNDFGVFDSAMNGSIITDELNDEIDKFSRKLRKILRKKFKENFGFIYTSQLSEDNK